VCRELALNARGTARIPRSAVESARGAPSRAPVCVQGSAPVPVPVSVSVSVSVPVSWSVCSASRAAFPESHRAEPRGGGNLARVSVRDDAERAAQQRPPHRQRAGEADVLEHPRRVVVHVTQDRARRRLELRTVTRGSPARVERRRPQQVVRPEGGPPCASHAADGGVVEPHHVLSLVVAARVGAVGGKGAPEAAPRGLVAARAVAEHCRDDRGRE